MNDNISKYTQVIKNLAKDKQAAEMQKKMLGEPAYLQLKKAKSAKPSK
jgi:hypothetical protein